MLRNASFANGLKDWNVEMHGGAETISSAVDDAAVLRVSKCGSEDWHVQFNQAQLPVIKGDVYTVQFRAAADCERHAHLSVQQSDSPWSSLGLWTTIAVTKVPQLFTFTFVASQSSQNARLNFGNLNQQDAEFRFSEISLKPGGRLGPGPDESIAMRSVRVPRTADFAFLPPAERLEWIRFLRETESDFWNEMRRFLKEDLGLKAPLIGTIVETSTPHLMADMDAIDTHAYWDSPIFPGKPWDMDNWHVNNTSMVDSQAAATVTRLAFQRVLGKPHIVSEYNHPAPNAYAAEAPLFVATFGALQDWDAIFLYTYGHDDEGIKAGYCRGFFDGGQHPTIMANVPVASLLFRRGDVDVAPRSLSVPLSRAGKSS